MLEKAKKNKKQNEYKSDLTQIKNKKINQMSKKVYQAILKCFTKHKTTLLIF